MRILFLTNLYPPAVLGGYELACKNVAQGLKDRDHEVRVLTTWCHLPVQEEAPDWLERALDLHWYVPYQAADVTVIQRDSHSAFCSSYGNTLRLLHCVRAFRPDIVYVWNLIGIGAVAMLDLLNYIGVPWAVHLMDRMPVEVVNHCPGYVLSVFNGQGAALYSSALILSMSQTLLDEIEEMSGIDFPQGVRLVPGWADPPVVGPHRPFLQDGAVRFVTAGNVASHKGIDLILEACAKLKGEGHTFTVDVFGTGELAKYADKARVMQVADRFRLFGPRTQSELLEIYADYDAFLFPTWEREPFGFAPIEAAGCGTPSIITRNCGASERLVDGVHCIKIDRTVDDLTDAMLRVASGSVNLPRLGRAARHLVSSDLSFVRCLDRIEGFLRSHARSWDHEKSEDPALPLLAFLKHNLSVNLRFG